MDKSLVALVGRANVGKSTLFNRIIRRKTAITMKEPGITRDRIYAEFEFNELRYKIVDTGGIDTNPDSFIEEQILKQVLFAINEANFIVEVVDSDNGLHPNDREIANLIRKHDRDFVIASNKIDIKEAKNNFTEFFQLNNRVFPISAEHNIGIEKLLKEITTYLVPIEKKKRPPSIAIIGRPNSGKSTLLNRLINKERALISDVPHTTRDPIREEIKIKGQSFAVVDTPGVKRGRFYKQKVDFFAIKRMEREVKNADVVILLIDLKEGLTHTDRTLVSTILDRGKALIIAFNKSDILTSKEEKALYEEAQKHLSFAYFVPVIAISAIKGKNINRLMNFIEEVHTERNKLIPVAVIKQLQPAIRSSLDNELAYRVRKIRQIGTAPIKFSVSIIKKGYIDENAEKSLKRILRAYFGFRGNEIFISWERSKK